MPFVKIAGHLVNTDNVAHVASDVTAQPPGKLMATDAVRIYFLSGDLLTLFGDEAAEAFAVLSPIDTTPVKAEPAKPVPAAPAAPTPTVKS